MQYVTYTYNVYWRTSIDLPTKQTETKTVGKHLHQNVEIANKRTKIVQHTLIEGDLCDVLSYN